MSKLDEKLAEGRALRKAARAVVETDLALLRSEWAPGPLAGRVASRTREKGAELSAQATDWGRRHGPLLATISGALAGAAGLWFARNPILRVVRKRKTQTACDPAGEE